MASSNLQYNARSDHAGCCSLFTGELLSDCQQIVRQTQPATIYTHTHTHTPSLQISSLSLPLNVKSRKTAAVVIEWVLGYYDSEMDRQVETDRLRNTAGEYREFTHNETCQFKCLKAKQQSITADNQGSHFISEKIFQGNFLPLTLTRL